MMRGRHRPWQVARVIMSMMGALLPCRPGLTAQHTTNSAESTSKRPNIVFIMADDLGWADVGFHGGNVPTPQLDRLAAANLELTQHYVAPVCTPTRTGLLTGRCWSRFGVSKPRNESSLPWDTQTLPTVLRAAGYETCLTGKWHLGSLPEWGPNHFGFDHSFGSLAGGVGPYDHFYKKGPYTRTWHRNEELIEQPGHVTDLIADEAVSWIKGRGNRPFFLYVAFTAVHLPVKEPDVWLQKVPAAISGEVPRHYAACTMHLDDAIGKIVDTLDSTGKRNNTLVVVTSDNGGSTAENNDTKYPADNYPQGRLPGNNHPLRGKKGDLYEGGICVPTIVSFPGHLPVGICSTPVQITDWMPTFCELAQATPDRDVKWDGRSLWSTMTGTAPLPTRRLYWVGTGSRSAAVRDGDWKLIVHRNKSESTFELFDLSRDPNETTNLAGSQREKVAALHAELDRMAQADNDARVTD